MNRKMRSRLSLLFTLLLSGLIIVAGSLSVSWLDLLIPDYKNEIVGMDRQHTALRLIYRNDDVNNAMFPWNYYETAKMQPLSESFQETLKITETGSLIGLLLDGTRTDQFAAQEQRFLFNPDHDNLAYLKDAELVSQRDKMPYLVDCAVDEKMGMLYFHKRLKDAPQVNKEQLEKAYEALLLVQKGLPDYDEYYDEKEEGTFNREENILQLYMQPILEEVQYQQQYAIIENFSLVLYDYFGNGNPVYSTEILTTDSELLFVISLGQGAQTSYSLIFFFEPVSMEFCGFSIQNDYMW